MPGSSPYKKQAIVFPLNSKFLSENLNKFHPLWSAHLALYTPLTVLCTSPFTMQFTLHSPFTFDCVVFSFHLLRTYCCCCLLNFCSLGSSRIVLHFATFFWELLTVALGDYYYSPQYHTLRASKGFHSDWAPLCLLLMIAAVPLGISMALEISCARECLGLIEGTLFVKMTIPGPGPDQEYIVPAPTAKPYTPPGWATCGYVGYDLQRHIKVFIKDTWWVDLPDIEKEGDTYVVMVAAQVKNIVPCSAAGDIGDNTTLTHLFKDEPWACKMKRVLVPHHHYQLVLDLIGKPPTTFSLSLQVLHCVLDALIGM